MTDARRDVEELDAMPALGPLLRRAAFGGAGGAVTLAFRRPPTPRLGPSRLGPSPLDPSPLGPSPLGPELLVRAVRASADHCAQYERVCGFAPSDRLPPTYPHVLSFPLALDLMTRPSFPLPALGLIHLHDVITQDRPLSTGEPYDVRVHATNLREHERGLCVELVSTVVAGGTEVWRETSTYLRRRSGGSRSSPDRAAVPARRETWPVGVDVGPSYARISGDRNPIHTSVIGARLFGFRRPIAHGMWSLARCLAALDHPDRFIVDGAFKVPILLPATVAFSTVDGAFALHDATTGRPHLAGRISPVGD